MTPTVLGNLGRLPAITLQETLVLETEYLDLERATALDHLLLAVLAEAPKREVTTRAGAYEISQSFVHICEVTNTNPGC